mmetsp:Transcript_54189/g.129082  ORF Transcript_54189/g.129082 Transcript_54189/m.129082 type:complete len:565 (-) Transcript_54189:55-1749(-)
MAVLLVVLLSCSTFFGSTDAKTFLAMEADLPPVPHLLEELERVLGRDHREDVEARALRLEEVMRPTFLALPKDAWGNIGLEAARYLVHRIFVDRHGWFVRGLASTGDSWNSSSPVDVVSQHLADEHADLIMEHIQESVTLHHTAVLAATLEMLVHAETEDRLRSAFRVAGLSSEDDELHASKDIVKALDTYMLFYVAGLTNHSRATARLVNAIFGKINDAYPMWEQTKTWARDVATKALTDESGTMQASFNDTLRAVEVIADQYGRWQDRECIELKDMLVRMEANGTGRVPLDVFYKSALEGQWQFSESIPYLQQLGALDDSNPAAPSVIIANYVNGPSNCVAASSFYSVCCIDECESILAHLETHIADPEASPEFIAELVSNLPSATVPAPRQLPSLLLQRLHEIAAHHGGTVPLHGRLFAQWLHHAYPRECQFPHLSGTTKPMTAKEWKIETGETSTITSEVLQEQVVGMQQRSADAASASAVTDAPGSDAVAVPWSTQEELYVGRASQSQRVSHSRRSLLRNLVFIALAISTMVAMARGVASALAASAPSCQSMKSAKYMV